jgi:hypothetical protein
MFSASINQEAYTKEQHILQPILGLLVIRNTIHSSCSTLLVLNKDLKRRLGTFLFLGGEAPSVGGSCASAAGVAASLSGDGFLLNLETRNRTQFCQILKLLKGFATTDEKK